ncbi:MAG: hypothetical protein AAF748_02000 [Pseudomonadota bacterium]
MKTVVLLAGLGAAATAACVSQDGSVQRFEDGNGNVVVIHDQPNAALAARPGGVFNPAHGPSRNMFDHLATQMGVSID